MTTRRNARITLSAAEYHQGRDEGGDMSAVLAFDGCYDARRTAALSGVPRSTVYDWARKGVVVPSISSEREKLWSYADLMALRIVSWLRHPKHLDEVVRPASAMRDVRDALVQLDQQGLDLWDGGAEASPLFVDPSGKIVIVTPDAARDLSGQGVLSDWLDLLGPFEGVDGAGPDLRRPRDHLRIVPGKCAGEPHLDGSRLTTITIAALADRGYTLDDVARLYPDESRQSLAEAIDLERSLGSLISAA
jgi:uncharacterized protein (DUF433 family)